MFTIPARHVEPREVARALNRCIEIFTDGEKGYAAAAADVRAPGLKAAFQEKAAERAAFVQELQAEVQKLGAYPENEGTATGTAHRGWVDLRLALEGRSDRIVVEECVRGEAAALDAFEKALGRTQLDVLPDELRALVHRQYAAILLGLDQARQRLALTH